MSSERRTVYIATRNEGKTREFARYLEPLGWDVKSLKDTEGIPDIVENGTTFAENAWIKAETVAKILGVAVLADDSGLCVDELEGDPGVYSARYAGVGAHDKDNNAKLLAELGSRGLRAKLDPVHPPCYSSARFVCALVWIDPVNKVTIRTEGDVDGYILQEPRGLDGFGYDPLFYLPEYGKSMAELDLDEKNRISHRAEALRKLLIELSGKA